MAAYTDSDAILSVIGQVGLDLRTDDADADALIADAVDAATVEVDWWCSRYTQAVLEANDWVRHAATWYAVKWLCTHRLNDVPKSVEKEWVDTYLAKLKLIQAGQATVPRAESSRKPIAVSNYHTDNRRLNNQGRVDRSRSTGVAKDYPRPTDTTAPPAS